MLGINKLSLRIHKPSYTAQEIFVFLEKQKEIRGRAAAVTNHTKKTITKLNSQIANFFIIFAKSINKWKEYLQKVH